MLLSRVPRMSAGTQIGPEQVGDARIQPRRSAPIRYAPAGSPAEVRCDVGPCR